MPKITHGLYTHPLYTSYKGMCSRCSDPKHKGYNRYGGNGISVCQEWLNNFKVFYDWAISHGWKKGLLLDRIDNERGYSPDNCRYVTMRESNINRSNTLYVTYLGEEKLLKDWCEILNKDYDKIWKYIYNRKLTVEQAFAKIAKPNRCNQLIRINGETMTLSGWCIRFNTTISRVWNRVNVLKWNIEDALVTPKAQKYKKERYESNRSYGEVPA